MGWPTGGACVLLRRRDEADADAGRQHHTVSRGQGVLLKAARVDLQPVRAVQVGDPPLVADAPQLGMLAGDLRVGEHHVVV
jgi:hypothetical protein